MIDELRTALPSKGGFLKVLLFDNCDFWFAPANQTRIKIINGVIEFTKLTLRFFYKMLHHI